MHVWEVREAGTPHPRKKIKTYLGIYNGLFMSSSHFREKLYWSGEGGGLASGEASANLFPEVLREI